VVCQGEADDAREAQQGRRVESTIHDIQNASHHITSDWTLVASR
jgi:hypothetical protein